jgi:hypothetical protein
MTHYTITNVPPVEATGATVTQDITGLIAAVTALLAVLVWPVLIGYALRTYREPITEILGRVRGAKGLGVELEMRDLIESTVEAQTSSSDEATAPIPAATDGGESLPADGNSSEGVDEGATNANLRPLPANIEYPSAELRAVLSNWLSANSASDSTFDSLARINRPSAILFAWGQVEQRIRQLAGISGLKAAPTFALLDQLRKEGLIRPSLYPLLKDLNRLRNRVAHSNVDLSETDIEQFRGSAQTAERELNEMIEVAIRRGRDLGEGDQG